MASLRSPASATGILLDLDGTMIDTNHLHTVAWWRALRRHGHTVAMQAVFDCIGMGGDKLMSRLIGEPDAQVEAAWSEEFHRLYEDVSPLPGARRMAQRFAEAGHTVVLATSAPEEDLSRARELLDIDEWLAGATASDDAEGSKPDPDIFDVALDRFDLDPSATLAVGDTIWDAEAAAAAGIGFIGVETGGHHPTELRRRGAIAVYADARAIADEFDASEQPSWNPRSTRGAPDDAS